MFQVLTYEGKHAICLLHHFQGTTDLIHRSHCSSTFLNVLAFIVFIPPLPKTHYRALVRIKFNQISTQPISCYSMRQPSSLKVPQVFVSSINLPIIPTILTSKLLMYQVISERYFDIWGLQTEHAAPP